MGQSARAFFQKGFLFLRLTRPIFLAGGALLYAFGAATATAAGYPIDWGKYLLGQILVTCIQLFAQYSNEYFDFDADRFNSHGRTWFSGGSGVLPLGIFPAETAIRAARVTGITSLALVFGLSFDIPLVGLIGFLALAGAWFYSAPPLALVSSGFGEFVASVIVCILVPFTAALVQTGGPLPLYLVGIVPLFFVHVAMLIAFAIPDYDADRQVGKGTLVVRSGLERSARWHNRLLLIGFSILAALSLLSMPPARTAWLAFPLAAWQMKSIHDYVRNPRDHPHRLTFGAVALFALLSGLLLFDMILYG